MDVTLYVHKSLNVISTGDIKIIVSSQYIEEEENKLTTVDNNYDIDTLRNWTRQLQVNVQTDVRIHWAYLSNWRTVIVPKNTEC